MSAVLPGKIAAVAAAIAFATVWGGAVYWLFSTGNEDWFTGVLVMAIFGLTLSGLAWLLTRGAEAAPIEVNRPAIETGVVFLYLVVYGVAFLGFGLNAIHAASLPEEARELLIMGAKLMAHVALPVLLLLMLRAPLAPLWEAGLFGRKFWRTLIILGVIVLALNSVISPSLRNIAETGAPWATLVWVAPVSFVWMAIEAGLNEEFLFRAVLQTRLQALFRSAWAGVLVSALVFGLVHAPGLYLRGGVDTDGSSADLMQVIAYTIAVLAPMGLLFGLIYERTKSLLLVVLLHGLVDVLPNMDDFIRIWT